MNVKDNSTDAECSRSTTTTSKKARHTEHTQSEETHKQITNLDIGYEDAMDQLSSSS